MCPEKYDWKYQSRNEESCETKGTLCSWEKLNDLKHVLWSSLKIGWMLKFVFYDLKYLDAMQTSSL
jgi:hypothetical protein